MNALTTNPTSAAGFGLLLSPASLKEAHEFAAMLAKSDLVPKAYQNKPGDIMIAGAMGARLGLDIFSALAGIACINGRPTLWGDAMLAVCQAKPDWEDMAEKITGAGETLEATCTVKRKGRSPYTTVFTAADAKRAGLWGKQGPWSTMPQRMCQMRARAFALRGIYADALSGFHAREEMDDEPREVEASVRVPEPTAAKEREIPADVQQQVEEKKDEKPAAEKAEVEALIITHQTVDKLAREIADKHRALGIAGIKAVNAELGVRLLSDITDAQIDDAHARLSRLAIALEKKS